MRKEYKIYNDNMTVTYLDTPEVRDRVFERVLQYCKEYDAHSGEQIHQNDDCIIYAPVVLSDILDDILETECKDEEDE